MKSLHTFLGIFFVLTNLFGQTPECYHPLNFQYVDKSGHCNNEIIYYNNTQWNVVKEGVVLVAKRNGTDCSINCTGFLLNTTLPGNDTLYILTDRHCFSEDFVQDTITIVWDYEENFSGEVTQYNRSFEATKLSESPIMDFILIKLKPNRSIDLPSCFKPYFFGWDISNKMPTSTASIHHPQAAGKKITFASSPPKTSYTHVIVPSTFCEPIPITPEYLGIEHPFWEVKYDNLNFMNGILENGSSGAPLLDEKNRVVGLLTVIDPIIPNATKDNFGILACNNNSPKYYFLKIKYPYSYHAENNKQLKKYLDPEGSNVLKIDGFYPSDPVFTATHFYEPNNYLVESEEVFPLLSNTFSGFLHSYIYPFNDLDYFKYKFSQPGKLTLILSGNTENFDLRLYNNDGTLIKESQNIGTENDTVSIFVYPTINIQNSYLVGQVYGVNGANSLSPYKLAVKWEPCSENYEPNNTRNAATSGIVPDLGQSPVGPKEILSRISDPNDEDWFAIHIEANGVLSVNLVNLPKDYNLELRTYQGNLLKSSSNPGLLNEQLVYEYAVPQSTILYLRIYGDKDNFTLCQDYKIIVSWQPTQPCATPQITYFVTPESAPGAGDGAIDVTVTGGTPPYIYAWTPTPFIIPDIFSLSGGVYTVFVSDATNCTASEAIVLNTQGGSTPACNGATTYTSLTGTFSDGSGSDMYAPYCNCSWLIQPPSASGILLTISGLDIASGDTLFVFDGISSGSQLLAAYTEGSTTLPINSSGGSLYVWFKSNGLLEGNGWTAHYNTVVEDNTLLLTGYEYWFDDDGNNREIRYFSPTHSRVVDIKFKTDGLAYGLHMLYMRFFDEQGNYSVVISSFFAKDRLPIVPSEFVKWEYWFDDESDYRYFEEFPFGKTFEFDGNIFESIELTDGLHSIHVRFKDNNGNWSSIVSSFFYKTIFDFVPNLIGVYRYWFDNQFSSIIEKKVDPEVDNYLLDNLISVANLPAGEHQIHLQFKDINGSWSSVLTDTFNVTVQMPFADFIYLNEPCTNSIVAFSNISTNAQSFVWHFGDGSTSIEINPVHVYAKSGNYFVTLEVTNTLTGQTATTSKTIIVTNTMAVAAISPAGNQSICEGASLILNGNNGMGLNYSWILNGLPITGANSQQYNATLEGNYQLLVTTAEGCMATSNIVQVSIIPKPSISVTPDGPIEFCQGNSVSLTASYSIGSVFNWYRNGGIIIGANQSTITITSQGVYYALASTAPGCNSISQVFQIIIHPAPILIATANDYNICVGEPVTLSATGAASYSWMPDGQTNETFTLYPSGSFTYTVIGISDQGCTSLPSSVSVSVNANPIVDLGNDIIASIGSTVQLDAGLGFIEYLWSTGEITQSIGVTTSGTYSVTVFDQNGCAAIDVVHVDFVVETQEVMPTRARVTLVPNPTMGRVTLEVQGLDVFNENTEIIVQNMLDEIVFRQFTDKLSKDAKIELDLHGLPPGSYLVRVRIGQVLISKLVVRI